MTASSSSIHKVALIGHGGAGKTTLAEALLASAGAIPRKGRVEDGSTVSDFEPEELKRHMSLSLSLAQFEHDGHKVNILDTPGFADFLPEVEVALAVADVAVLVVSAVEGVEVQTEVLWREAARRGVPRIIFINKLDHERADFERTLADLLGTFGSGVAPLELPLFGESGFRGVADLLADSAITYEAGQPSTGPIPDDIAEAEHRVRENLVEGIVVADDAMMERYLEGDTPSAIELEATLAHGHRRGNGPSQCKTCAAAATEDIAIDRLAASICVRSRRIARRPHTPARSTSRSRRTPRASRWLGYSRRSSTPSSVASPCSRCCPDEAFAPLPRHGARANTADRGE